MEIESHFIFHINAFLYLPLRLNLSTTCFAIRQVTTTLPPRKKNAKAFLSALNTVILTKIGKKSMFGESMSLFASTEICPSLSWKLYIHKLQRII